MALPGKVSGWGIAALAAGAVALAGCSSSSDLFSKDAGGKWFSQPFNVFAKPGWGTFSSSKDAKDKDALRAVAAEDFVDASGRCGGAVEPSDSAVGTMAGDLGSIPSGAGLPATTPGGVALTMTECEVVRRAGQPENIEIGANESGERRTVLTYLRGNLPGIYRFTAGRLNEIERAPLPPEPPKPPPRKKKPAKPKTAAK